MSGWGTQSVVLPEGYEACEATLDDVEGILAVELLAQPSPWSAKVFEKEFTLDYSHLWVIKAGEAVAAFLVFWVIYDEVHILNVAVHPEHRRRGLARAFVNAIIAESQGLTMTSVTLEVRVGNVAARSLYEGLGFLQIGTRPRYYSDNQEDAAVLARIIEDI